MSFPMDQQPTLNYDMLLTEDFLGLTQETENFFNSLSDASDEDLFSSSSEVSTPQMPASTQPNVQYVLPNNNGFQFVVATQDPNNNIVNFQYQIPQNGFVPNFAVMNNAFIKQENGPATPQSFMILPAQVQTPQMMTYQQESDPSDDDLEYYEPAPKIVRTSTTTKARNYGTQPQVVLQQVQQSMQIPNGAQPVKPLKRKLMEKFSEDKLSDFKRVIYNSLVEHHNQCLLNNTDEIDSFVLPIRIEEGEKVRTGFQFNESHSPEKKLPELYAKHIRNSHLEKEDSSSIFIQDLYRFYMRACLELLGKYFDKRGKFTFLYDEETPLFVPGHSIAQAEVRIRSMKTRARMNKKRKTSK